MLRLRVGHGSEDPPREILLSAFPSTSRLVNMTDMPQYREITNSEPEDRRPGSVWQSNDRRGGRHPTTSGDARDEKGGGDKRNEVSQGAVTMSLAPTSAEQAVHTDSVNHDRRSVHRRLLVVCAVVRKVILRGQHVASHDIKAAQWANSKGTCREVITLIAELGLWATTLQLEHREDNDFHAKIVRAQGSSVRRRRARRHSLGQLWS